MEQVDKDLDYSHLFVCLCGHRAVTHGFIIHRDSDETEYLGCRWRTCKCEQFKRDPLKMLEDIDRERHG